jgi:hypothetical protein
MKFDFQLTGVMPILFHADDIFAGDALKAWRDDPDNANRSVKGDDRSPPWSYQAFLYFDGAYLTIPSDNVMASLRWAGAKIPLKKGTYKELTQSGLLISTEYCKFAGPKGPVRMADLHKIRDLDFAKQADAVKAMGFSLFCKRATIGQAKHVRVRARFDEWSLGGTVEIVNADVTPEVLRRIFEIAGDRSGLLDWRPSSKKGPGPFGRFSTSLKPAK